MTTVADPTSINADPTGAANWYAEYGHTVVPEPGTVTLPNASGEPVTYYRRGHEPRTERAMCWPALARW